MADGVTSSIFVSAAILLSLLSISLTVPENGRAPRCSVAVVVYEDAADDDEDTSLAALMNG